MEPASADIGVMRIVTFAVLVGFVLCVLGLYFVLDFCFGVGCLLILCRLGLCLWFGVFCCDLWDG